MYERRTNPVNWGQTLAMTFAALAAASLFAISVASAGDRGSCIRVHVDQPVRLPDGNVYPSGVLTLCDSMTLSPVATLHKTYVNGRPVGMLVSRRRSNETRSDTPPAVVFQRIGGTLDLVGYVLPAPRRNGITYVLNAGLEMPAGEVRAEAPGGSSDSLVVLTASAR